MPFIFDRELEIEAVAAEPTGVSVAVADIDGDGTAELIVGSGSSADVTVYNGRTGEEVLTLTAEVEGAGGVRVAGAVISEDGMADLLVGSAAAGAWAAYDGIGDPLEDGTLTGFDDGVWVARSPRQDDVNRHAAQVVLDWNDTALDAIRATSTPPPLASRALAILQTAVYDAVNGIVKGGRKFLVTPAAPVGASLQAAAAQAAHDTLVDLFLTEARRSTTCSRSSARRDPRGTAKDDGSNGGATVAAAVLEARADDGSAEAARPRTPGTDPGTGSRPRRATPRPCSPAGDVTPFGIAGSGPSVPGRPKLTGRKWAADFNQGRIGSATSTTRRPTRRRPPSSGSRDSLHPARPLNAIAAGLVDEDGSGCSRRPWCSPSSTWPWRTPPSSAETKFKYTSWRR